MKSSETKQKVLTSGQQTEYLQKGYLKLGAVFSAEETRQWRDECNRLWEAAANLEDDPSVLWRGHSEKGRIADRFDPVTDRSPVFKQLSKDERILQPVRELLGTDITGLKDKLITKRPGTMGYGMHQDFPYRMSVDIPADEMLSVLISIDTATKENGALELFPGLHQERLPAPPDEPLDVDETKMDLSRGEVMETGPGDVLIFHSLTPHRSGPNRSNTNRRIVYFSFVPSKYATARERFYKLKPY